MASGTLFMETTKISADRTAAEITSCLMRAGAAQIMCEYESGSVAGLRWTMKVGPKTFLFSMPARIVPVYDKLVQRYPGRNSEELRGKARRVAWRQLLRWVQAQLAMIDIGMAEPTEVFFAYLDNGKGRTLFQVFKESEYRLLEAPKS